MRRCSCNCLSSSRFSARLRSSSSRRWAYLFACWTCRSIARARLSLSLAREGAPWPLADSNRSEGAYSLPASEASSLSLSFIEISMLLRHKFALSSAFSVSVRCSCNPLSSKNDSYSSLARLSSLSASSIFAASSLLDFSFRKFQLSERLGPMTTVHSQLTCLNLLVRLTVASRCTVGVCNCCLLTVHFP